MLGADTDIDILRGYEAALRDIADQIHSFDAARQGAPSTVENITGILEEIGILDAGQ